MYFILFCDVNELKMATFDGRQVGIIATKYPKEREGHGRNGVFLSSIKYTNYYYNNYTIWLNGGTINLFFISLQKHGEYVQLGVARIDRALQLSYKDLFGPNGSSRPGIQKIAVVITYGKQTPSVDAVVLDKVTYNMYLLINPFNKFDWIFFAFK